jgi:hypothetical protein
MILRKADHYTTGYSGRSPEEAPFYRRALVFDSEEGDYNAYLIRTYNERVRKKYSVINKKLLTGEGASPVRIPERVIIINASHDDLPTSYETERIFREYFRSTEYGENVFTSVVNSRDELEAACEGNYGRSLVVSQCVDRKVYDVGYARQLEARGAVIVPGRVTAPGGIFSDKDSTYRLLSDNGRDWSMVARYVKVGVGDTDATGAAYAVLDTVDKMKKELGDDTFFVKPPEGGGGLGGFRITVHGNEYIIPDLSKVNGDVSDVHPTFIDIDPEDEKKLRELLWVWKLFSSDVHLSRNYIKTPLSVNGESEAKDMRVMKDYLVRSASRQKKRKKDMALSRHDAAEKLSRAFLAFEKKFGKRYVPLVNEHIDFGLWGLRAHFRLSRRGPVVETLYHRIFQLAFTEEGIGYLGSDNISNKQTGELEIMRLGPLDPVLVESSGGEEKLFASLDKGSHALLLLADRGAEREKYMVPFRVQLDIAAVASRIGEGNADTARGMCLASRWTDFIENAEEWIRDSINYYSWKKTIPEGGRKL